MKTTTMTFEPSTTPLVPETGKWYFDEDNNVFRYYDGTLWKVM